jgi:hypothetical protein
MLQVIKILKIEDSPQQKQLEYKKAKSGMWFKYEKAKSDMWFKYEKAKSGMLYRIWKGQIRYVL